MSAERALFGLGPTHASRSAALTPKWPLRAFPCLPRPPFSRRYGPFWIATTLVLLIAAGGQFVAWQDYAMPPGCVPRVSAAAGAAGGGACGFDDAQHARGAPLFCCSPEGERLLGAVARGDKVAAGFAFDVQSLAAAGSLLYTFLLAAPASSRLVMAWLGLRGSQPSAAAATAIGVVPLVCVYGYALAPFLPATVSSCSQSLRLERRAACLASTPKSNPRFLAFPNPDQLTTTQSPPRTWPPCGSCSAHWATQRCNGPRSRSPPRSPPRPLCRTSIALSRPQQAASCTRCSAPSRRSSPCSRSQSSSPSLALAECWRRFRRVRRRGRPRCRCCCYCRPW